MIPGASAFVAINRLDNGHCILSTGYDSSRITEPGHYTGHVDYDDAVREALKRLRKILLQQRPGIRK